ncbi:hypothetical protein CK203_109501 [Vitis vinifera]|uniref:Aspartic peptidase DDI1-type domain-containing protein n=1 Tax=Vitis vinifera TaxID=29760 RepID=A0A438CHC1_VITVI|nr:hypothetical protein CK203_109501 [Vitis vinifera]
MIKQVPTCAKFLKDLCTIKRGLNVKKKAFLTEQVSAIIQCKSLVKYKYSGCPTISVMIGGTCVEKALLDLGASVNLLPYSIYKQLGLGELKPTSITLSLADRSVNIPRGMIEDVLVQVDKFYYPVDFVVLDTDSVAKGTNYVPIILGRPFLATSNDIINCRNGGGDTRAIKEEPPKLILKPLPTELKYAYLEENKHSPVVISSSLTLLMRIVYLKSSGDYWPFKAILTLDYPSKARKRQLMDLQGVRKAYQVLAILVNPTFKPPPRGSQER